MHRRREGDEPNFHLRQLTHLVVLVLNDELSCFLTCHWSNRFVETISTLLFAVTESMMTMVNRTVHSGSHFPAICWLFGKQLHARLKRPIGLVSATFSDSLLEEWVPSQVIDTCHVKFTDRYQSLFSCLLTYYCFYGVTNFVTLTNPRHFCLKYTLISAML